MSTLCVFCGNKPNGKTKEHIFPQWLLKMTDFYTKTASVGTNWSTGKEILFPAKNYTFPACDFCNGEFATIEDRAKDIIESLLEDKNIIGAELELLLDWFDKIRIGAWLGVTYMNKKVFDMKPHFYINKRVGLKDRYLSITNTYLPTKTLNWSGANTLTFMTSPTALSLRINNLVFVNASTEFLVSKSVGFPFASIEIPRRGTEISDFVLTPGTKKISEKLFQTRLYMPSIVARQPIFTHATEANKELYDDEFYKNNSYDFSLGVGKIFVSKNQKTSTIERASSINFSMPTAKSIYGKVEVVRPILELQIELLKKRINRLHFHNNFERQKQMEASAQIVRYTKEQIKQYNY